MFTGSSVAGQSMGQDFRLHIEISQGLPYVDYDALAKKNHLSAMVFRSNDFDRWDAYCMTIHDENSGAESKETQG